MQERRMTGGAAAFGGPGWSPRTRDHTAEIGSIWTACGVASEYAPLRRVLLHRPGAELGQVADPQRAQLLEAVDADGAAREHDALAAAYRDAGVDVAYVEPPHTPPDAPPPNLMFVADLMFMTPAGAVLARPASTVRAGEERWVARRLADLGVPILRSVTGTGTFEGADAMYLAPDSVLIGVGLRTNRDGANQVAATLDEQGIASLVVDLPHGAMHLMGQIRILDHDLAFVRAGRTPWSAVHALREHGYDVHFFPDDDEMDRGYAHNVVSLGPRRLLMPAGNPVTQRTYEAAGVECITVDVSQLRRAAGAIGCLTGIVRRSDEK